MDKKENFHSMPQAFAIIKDLVKDYNVDNDFKMDDSEQLQKAIYSDYTAQLKPNHYKYLPKNLLPLVSKTAIL